MTRHAGLHALAQGLRTVRLRAAFSPSLTTIPKADNFMTATALLALGKCGFEADSALRDDPAFARLLWLKRWPFAAILRQRVDQATDA